MINTETSMIIKEHPEHWQAFRRCNNLSSLFQNIYDRFNIPNNIFDFLIDDCSAIQLAANMFTLSTFVSYINSRPNVNIKENIAFILWEIRPELFEEAYKLEHSGVPSVTYIPHFADGE